MVKLRRKIISISLLLAITLPATPGLIRSAQAAQGIPDISGMRQQVAASILKDAGSAAWVAEGQSTHVIYIFFDPNCPYCHVLYDSMRPWVEHNQIQLRWIPIGTLMTTSFGKAAAILEAKNPLAAFRRNEVGFSKMSGFGQISEDPLPDDATAKKLKANAELLHRTGNDAVPTMVFRLADGTADLVQGAPPRAYLQRLVRHIK
ncbi:MAG: thioredoxin fold domain-containing protein [Acidiferrobacterales bacterium]